MKKICLTICCITAISGCSLNEDGRRGLKSAHNHSAPISQQTPGNPERQITVRLQAGEMRFYGSISPFWPEEFVLNEGEVRQIRLYEKFQPLKQQNNYVDIWVAHSPGVLVLDANPVNWQNTNFGIWLELGAQSFQRFSRVSAAEQFSTTEARGLTITIIKPL